MAMPGEIFETRDENMEPIGEEEEDPKRERRYGN
jgi:hypothetical protein